VIRVGDKKTQIKCRLITRGTENVEAEAISDLSVPDPESAIGKKIVDEAMGNLENDEQS
jgi:hypothetical protein